MDSGLRVDFEDQQLRCWWQDLAMPWYWNYLRTLSSAVVAGEQTDESAWLGTSGPSAGERPLPGSSIVAGLMVASVAIEWLNLPYLLSELLRLVFQVPLASCKDDERKGLERLAELARWQPRRLSSMLELV